MSRQFKSPLPWLGGFAVALAGVVASMLLAQQQARSVASLDQTRFEQAADRFTGSLSRRLDAYSEITLGLRGLFLVDPDLNRSAFAEAARQLDVVARYPGVKNLAFTRHVPASAKTAFEAQVRAESPDHAGFAIHPAGERPEYFVADYLWPPTGNDGVMGLDIGSQPANMASLNHSRITGQPTASAPFELIQESERRAGFVIRVPVFAPANGVSPNADGFLGTVGVTVRVYDLITNLTDQGLLEGLALSLTDRGSLLPGAAPDVTRPLFVSSASSDAISHVRNLDLHGRHWQLAFQPTAPFVSAWEQRLPLLVGGGGSLISILLGALFTLLAQARVRAVEQARLTAEALRESEARWKFALEGAGDGVWFWDAASSEMFFSKRWKEIFGLSDAEATQEAGRWLERVHPDDLPLVKASIRAELSGSASGAPLEFRMRGPGGGWMWLLSRGMVVSRDAQGRPLQIVGTHTDITRRKAVEADLRVAATAFETQEATIVTDADQVILRVNQAFVDITGYSAEEAVGQTPRLLNSGRHDKAFYQAMWESLARTGTWRGEIWDRRKNGEIYPSWLTITAVKGQDGQITHYVGVHTDLTERKAAEEEIRSLAFYDLLTRLPNRRLLLDRLHHALSAGGDSHGAVLLIDLDHFKNINETVGHEMGDQLLRQVARRLSACVREGDAVARQGGDEFVVILNDLGESKELAAAHAERVATDILAALNQAYRLGGREHYTGASIGLTLFGGTGETVDELLKRADVAMYQAKAAGRNTLRFFDPDMQAAVSARAALEADLRVAVRERQLELHYQPQVDDGRVTGVEALVRWRHPQRGYVSPAEFIPLAEDCGLILPLGQWVMETACRQLTAWAERPETAHLTVAVNVSPEQFRQPDFVERVLEVLASTGAAPGRLKLELTEGLLLSDVEDVIAKMGALKSHGLGFSLDDFGTGYSSLSYLKRLPLDQLKIDQSFVRDVLTDPNDAAIARTIVALAESLGLAVIAEGVETEAQREFLAAHNCRAWQGYLCSRPLPVSALEEFMAQRRAAAPSPQGA